VVLAKNGQNQHRIEITIEDSAAIDQMLREQVNEGILGLHELIIDQAFRLDFPL